MNKWPFKYVNGVQTPESVHLIESKPIKPATLYEQVISDPDIEDALL